jgi:hypothetical protein
MLPYMTDRQYGVSESTRAARAADPDRSERARDMSTRKTSLDAPLLAVADGGTVLTAAKNAVLQFAPDSLDALVFYVQTARYDLPMFLMSGCRSSSRVCGRQSYCHDRRRIIILTGQTTGTMVRVRAWVFFSGNTAQNDWFVPQLQHCGLTLRLATACAGRP